MDVNGQSPKSEAPLSDHSIEDDFKASFGPPLNENDTQVVERDFVPLQALPVSTRYTRSSKHASGGMGTVWLARDAVFGREVALKELHAPGLDGNVRFLREARITGQLEHPGVVPVYELGHDPLSGRPFYVMRFVRGRTLTEAAEAFHDPLRPTAYDSLELVRLLAAFVAVCNTIAYAHSRGILHRDLKGENIVLGDFGEVIVLDWGLAKRLTDADDLLDEPFKPSQPTAGQTMMGEAIGTPAYMAPEQASGQLDLIGTHTDIFGLGAILYEILTGVPPFDGPSAHAVILRASMARVDPPSKYWPSVPHELQAICLKALSRHPADRHRSAIELAEQVQGWQDHERKKAETELRVAFDRMHEQQRALVQLTRTEVHTGQDVQTAFQHLVETTARVLRVERASIWRYSADRQTLRCESLFELSQGRHSSGVELRADAYPNYFEALKVFEVIAADDAQADPRTREFTEGYLKPLGIGAMMEIPVPPDGVFCCEHVGPPRKWQPDEQMFGLAVGHLSANVVSHAERREALRKLEAVCSVPGRSAEGK